MTPDQREKLRDLAERGLVRGGNDFVLSLLSDIDDLNRELAEARLSAEEAWDNYDRVTETR